METRKVTVFATRGQSRATIMTSAETWGELQEEVIGNGFDLEKLEAGESVNKTTLKHNDAKLPEQDFILFLRPKESKAGSEMTYSELKDIARNDSDFRDYLEETTDKNWTRCSKEEYQTAYNEYFNGTRTFKKDYTEVEVHNTQEVSPSSEGSGSTSILEVIKGKLSVARNELEAVEQLVYQMENSVIDTQAKEEAEYNSVSEKQRLEEDRILAEERAEMERLEQELKDFEAGL